jgi:threonine dehydrogenase-like Zn-dependent dehydrogenase
VRGHAGVDDASHPRRTARRVRGLVGVPHGVELDGEELFFEHVHLHGGPAPVRKYLPKLIDLVLNGKINPGKVFDLTLPLDQVAEGYRAMDERRAIKALLRP